MSHAWFLKHACNMQGFRTFFRYGTCMDWCLNFIHVSCMKYTWKICTFHAWNLHIPDIFHVWNRRIPSMIQAYFIRGTGVFQAWYRHIPCMVRGHSMRGTGVFLSWVHHAQYSYRHINPWTEYSCTILAVILYTLKHCAPAWASILFKKLIVYRYWLSRK